MMATPTDRPTRSRSVTEPASVRLRRLLVVEDNEHVANALVSVLGKQGYDVLHAATGESGLAILDDSIDAVLLDLGLPDIDGFEVCRRIRQRSEVPLLMATARADLESRVRGLQMGADDYVTKPYDVREVLARLEAVLRRSPDSPAPEDRALQVADIRIDSATREVTRGGTPLDLTRKEFDLLLLLARQHGLVVPRQRILFEVWGADFKSLGRTLEVHIGSLRAKLGDRSLIRTVRGVGYRLVLDDADRAPV
jgi:DNA-binding response OmpR family regulator